MRVSVIFKPSNTSTNANKEEGDESDTSDGLVMVTHVAKDKNSSVRHQLAMMKNKEPNLTCIRSLGFESIIPTPLTPNQMSIKALKTAY